MVAALLIVDSHGTSSTLQRILPNNLPGVLQLDVWGGGGVYNYVFFPQCSV